MFFKLILTSFFVVCKKENEIERKEMLFVFNQSDFLHNLSSFWLLLSFSGFFFVGGGAFLFIYFALNKKMLSSILYAVSLASVSFIRGQTQKYHIDLVNNRVMVTKLKNSICRNLEVPTKTAKTFFCSLQKKVFEEVLIREEKIWYTC